MASIAELPGRAVISLSGADRVSFLNGLVSNDVAKADPGQAMWAALLTAQGRYLADFFIFAETGRLLLDVAAIAAEDLVRRLGRYRLRAEVRIELLPAMRVYAAWGGMPPEVPLTAPDPRLREAGYRMLSETPVAADAGAAAYDGWRLGLGLPDGPPDLEVEKTLLLEAGFDELNGIDWRKGCYMGQELTARTRYRGLVKRRLLPVAVNGALPPAGTPVLAAGVEVGSVRSGRGAVALATLRLDALDKGLAAGGARLTPRPASWMKLPG